MIRPLNIADPDALAGASVAQNLRAARKPSSDTDDLWMEIGL